MELSKKFKNRLLLPFILFFSLVLVLLPQSEASAAGWNYNLNGYDHWGSNPCTTSYPVIKFHINSYNANGAYVQIEKKVGSSWKYVTGTQLSGYDVTLSTDRSSPTTQYRAYVYTPMPLAFASGSVKCQGAWR